MKSKDRICIGIVNDGKINSRLLIDLLHIATKRAHRFDSIVQVANIGLLTRSRNVVIKNYLDESDANWILLLDADERIPLEAFDKLVAAADEKERPVMSGLVFGAFEEHEDRIRPVPLIYRENELGLQPIDDFAIDSIIPVSAAGTGCLLIHRSVLLTMQEKATPHQGKDWAWFVDGAIDGRWFGEDLLFCKRIESLGYPIYAHTGAILSHRKEFWLDARHHAPLREAAVQSNAQANPPGA